MIYTVDVWHSTSFPVVPDQDWRRYRVDAGSGTEAELIACQMAASSGGRTPTRSVVTDWPDP